MRIARALHGTPLRGFGAASTGDGDGEDKDSIHAVTRPTVEEVQMLPRHVSEYSAEMLISAALHGDEDAIRERLVREVMRVDQIEWREATVKVDEIAAANQSGSGLLKAPYLFGIAVGFTGAWGVIPFVFDLGTAEWFNEGYVTTEHPQPEDVETWLEVGAWTWNWMEPVLGTVSFQLLALQFMRAQMLNVGFKPFTAFILSSRADRLANRYPTYARSIVRKFAKSNIGLGEYSQAG